MEARCKIGSLVSVVLPVFNAADFIAEAISSVLGQTHKEIELIVVDDCSTDGTHAVVNSLFGSCESLRYFRLEANSGTPAVPRNFGVSRAAGDFVAFIDADDVWHPQKLELQLSCLRQQSAEAVSARSLDFNSRNGFFCKKIEGSVSYKKIRLLNQLIKYRTPTSSLLLSRSMAERFPFPEDLFFRGKEDLVQSLDLHSGISYSLKLNCVLVGYRIHPFQISSNKISMFCKVLCISWSHKNSLSLVYKFFSPFFVLANILLTLYYRILRKSL